MVKELFAKIIFKRLFCPVCLFITFRDGIIYEIRKEVVFAEQLSFDSKYLIGLGIVCLFIITIQLILKMFYNYREKLFLEGFALYKRLKLLQALEKLRHKDRNFSESVFCDRSKEAFFRLKRSWNEGGIACCRNFLSDGIYERYKVQRQLHLASKVIKVINCLDIDDIKITDISFDNKFDYVTVLIKYDAAVYYELQRDREVFFGSKEPTSHQQYLTFLRKNGVVTSYKNGLFENVCPQCGGELKSGMNIFCLLCKCRVNTGEYDWVLCGVSKHGPWKLRSAKNISGYNELIARDPEFSLAHVEDRVTVFFWQYIVSLAFSENRQMKMIATRNFLNENADLYNGKADELHSFQVDVRISSVELLSIFKDLQRSEDVLRVRVRWSGRRVKGTIPGLVTPDSKAAVLQTSEYILKRDIKSRSSKYNLVNSKSCPNCGTPGDHKTLPYCSECHRQLNDLRSDWMLDEIKLFSSYDALNKAFLIESEEVEELPEVNDEAVISCAVRLLLMNEKFDKQRQNLIYDMAEARGLNRIHTGLIISTVKRGGYSYNPPDSLHESELFVKAMAIIAMGNGIVSADERVMLYDIGECLAMHRWEIRKIIAATERDLVRKIKKLKQKYSKDKISY